MVSRHTPGKPTTVEPLLTCWAAPNAEQNESLVDLLSPSLSPEIEESCPCTEYNSCGINRGHGVGEWIV